MTDNPWTEFCRRTIPHWREGCTRAMPERCSVSTVNTTRSTSKHFKTLLTRLIGQAFALLLCYPLTPCCSFLDTLPSPSVPCSLKHTKRLLSCLRSWKLLTSHSLLKSIKRYANHFQCHTGSLVAHHMHQLSHASFLLLTCATQILDTHNKVEEKKELYVPYNILPLDPESTGQAIMRYPEVFIHLFFLIGLQNTLI